jgi:hypothetical protein
MPDVLTIVVLAGIPIAVMIVLVMRYFSIDLVYLNTRFNVIGNPNMSSSRLADALATGDRKEAAKRLSTRYFPIEDSASVDDAESRMNEVNRQLLGEALEKVPRRIRPFYEALMMTHEVDEVRSSCAALKAGADVAVSAVGRIDARTADAISRCQSTSEIIALYLDVTGHAVPDEPGDEDLDAALLRTMEEAKNGLKGLMGRPLREIMRSRIDAELVLLALRMHLHGTPERLVEIDLPEGHSVSGWMLDEIARDPAKGVGSLANTDLDAISGMSDPAGIQRALTMMTFEMAGRVYSRRFMTIGPLTRFLLYREFETANARAVLMGAAAGMEWSAVEGATITEEGA